MEFGVKYTGVQIAVLRVANLYEVITLSNPVPSIIKCVQ